MSLELFNRCIERLLSYYPEHKEVILLMGKVGNIVLSDTQRLAVYYVLSESLSQL